MQRWRQKFLAPSQSSSLPAQSHTLIPFSPRSSAFSQTLGAGVSPREPVSLAVRASVVDHSLRAQLRVWWLENPAVGELRQAKPDHTGDHNQHLHCFLITKTNHKQTEIWRRAPPTGAVMLSEWKLKINWQKQWTITPLYIEKWDITTPRQRVQCQV